MKSGQGTDHIKMYDLYTKVSSETSKKTPSQALPGVLNPRPTGHMRPGMAMNAAQHKIVNLLKTFDLKNQYILP